MTTPKSCLSDATYLTRLVALKAAVVKSYLVPGTRVITKTTDSLPGRAMTADSEQQVPMSQDWVGVDPAVLTSAVPGSLPGRVSR
jgi:hypothetical protein